MKSMALLEAQLQRRWWRDQGILWLKETVERDPVRGRWGGGGGGGVEARRGGHDYACVELPAGPEACFRSRLRCLLSCQHGLQKSRAGTPSIYSCLLQNPAQTLFQKLTQHNGCYTDRKGAEFG